MDEYLIYLGVGVKAFDFLGYELTYAELVGTVACLWSVWLITRCNIWTWPIGIVSVLLYFAIFYKLRLYADVVEQVFYLITNLYGWWLWNESQQKSKEELPIYRSTGKSIVFTALGTLVVSLGAAILLTRAHTALPVMFPEEASYPFIDAWTTIMSFVATGLMVWRRLECWVYWILVDVIGIWLYYTKGVLFIALLSAILLILATKGLFSWFRAYKAQPAIA